MRNENFKTIQLKVAQASFKSSKWRSLYKVWQYNVSRNSNIMVPYETLIIAEQDVVIIMTYLVALTTVKPSKNTLYFGFNCSYLKNKRGNPHFLLLELSDQEAKINFLQSLRVLYRWFRATLPSMVF